MATVIPNDHPLHQTLSEVATTSRIVVFSGLPGVGKSLYINEFYNIAIAGGRKLTVIQWDLARKGFETPLIMQRFPMVDSMVHDGLKLLAGQWLSTVISSWVDATEHRPNELLLLEAPLVGHRFVEIIQKSPENALEQFLQSEQCKILIPIPSKEVRMAIEAARSREVDEDALSWMGAKPSVMQVLWRHVCEIANEFGYEIDLSAQPAYDPAIYEKVFERVCRHRHMIPLRIKDIFTVPAESENAFHQLDSLVPSPEEADQLFNNTVFRKMTDKELSEITADWYSQ